MARTEKFTGAWLTDVDDTLIPSGRRPDDRWIDSLAEFLASLKKQNIVWAPVSGVALNRMGPRLLFRLPRELLTHVMYYGGEGGTKSFFDPEKQQWISPKHFQRNFSDEQALVILGGKRFFQALEHAGDEPKTQIKKRIARAEKNLQKTPYANMPPLLDTLEKKLSKEGFNPDRAETHFRGGAVSWMMLGDTSVKHYRGKQETTVREALNTWLRKKLQELNHLSDIGDHGIHMPYPHATRGIKLVLMGNDKSRAAKDLIDNEGISADAVLFVGNELYAGGNDDPVRHVEDIVILSVGEKQDDGVIDGGIGVDDNRHWMRWITDRLQQISWQNILKELPETARLRQLAKRIDREKENAHRISDWHASMSRNIPTPFLTTHYDRFLSAFRATRKQLVKIKRMQYDLVARLAVLEQYHYDNARKIVCELFNPELQQQNQTILVNRLKQFLLPELKMLLRQFFVDQLNVKEKKVCRQLSRVSGLNGLDSAINALIEQANNGEKFAELKRINNIVETWEIKIEQLVNHYFCRVEKWRQKQRAEQKVIEAEIATNIPPGVSVDDLYHYYKWLAPRLDDIPHLKDLDKPTIVLVAGTSGVGKSTLSRHISRTMGIPTSFSSDVASRSVIRETLAFLLGNEQAREIFPEIFGSSFEKDSLDWFYAHALMTMVGVTGNINRLIKENISAVIDGVALIPGALPEEYFEKANIVWIVAGVGDMNIHYERLGTRSETGIERGGADRYRENFSAIRRNHDRLLEMAERSDSFTIDNSGHLETPLARVVQRVADPFADRGLPVADAIRQKVRSQLQERTTWEIQNVVANTNA